MVLSNSKIVELQFLVNVDNDVRYHVSLGDFQRIPQGERCYLTYHCFMSSEETKVTQFSRFCTIMTININMKIIIIIKKEIMMVNYSRKNW